MEANQAATNIDPGGGLQATPNVPSQVNNPPAAPVFTLTPALLNTGFLDWTKPENNKLYTKAIEKLDFKFEGKPD